jgi:hypothetical protein
LIQNFIKYILFFIVSSVGVIGVLTLLTLYQENRELFSQTLSDLGAFGSFLSGMGTIIAAGVAAYGVDTWSKQLKSGKYLALIWEAKALVSKFNNAFFFWHAFYKIDSQELKVKSDKCYKEMMECTDTLSHLAFQLDALGSSEQETWVRHIRGLTMLITDHERFVSSENFSQTDLNVYAQQVAMVSALFQKKDSYIKKLHAELDELEKKWK